jgi:hypothetical protein
MKDTNIAHHVDYPEVPNPTIAMLINFASRRLKLDRFINKRHMADIIQDPLLSQKFPQSQFRQ